MTAQEQLRARGLAAIVYAAIRRRGPVCPQHGRLSPTAQQCPDCAYERIHNSQSIPAALAALDRALTTLRRPPCYR